MIGGGWDLANSDHAAKPCANYETPSNIAENQVVIYYDERKEKNV